MKRIKVNRPRKTSVETVPVLVIEVKKDVVSSKKTLLSVHFILISPKSGISNYTMCLMALGVKVLTYFLFLSYQFGLGLLDSFKVEFVLRSSTPL